MIFRRCWLSILFRGWTRHCPAIPHHLQTDYRSGGSTPKLKWLCTLEDFTFPQQTRQGENLVSLALNHGIGVSSAHRALTDCQLIVALFDRMDDLEGMINKADRPKALYKAQVPYEKKDLAKAAGFKWNADKKIWTRRMATADTVNLPFPVQEILNSN
jgi:DNA polymerase III subunit epsilon